MIKYRPDIDGLRGIAVLIVVLFHAGLPHILGGFVGVDIFFVISGYLITSIILKDLNNKVFSYTNFYERRARRILPALYFMVLIVMAVVLFIQMPSDLIKSSNTVITALLFSSNIYFWRTTDYFSGESELEFFLHTWSLGVEEQFYFVFPVFLLLCIRKPRLLKVLFITGFIASFAISVYATYKYEWAAYYLLPSRAWQMMAGALIAIYPVTLPKRTSITLPLSLLCLACLLVPAFTYSHEIRFPGVAALAPTIGATLAIILGSSTSFVTRCLSFKPLVWLGLISYSLYLWHWPVFAGLRNYQGYVDLPYHYSVIGIVVSILLAYLSWRFVETPFRNKTAFTRKSIFTLSAVSSVLIILSAGFIVVKDGLPSRVNPDIVALSNYSGGHILGDRCMHLTDADIQKGELCLLNADSSMPPSFVLWGDSHAASLKKELIQLTVQEGMQGIFFGNVGCPPLPGILKTNFDTGYDCLTHNQAAMEAIIQNKTIDTVVLHARWALSVDGERYIGEKAPPPPYILEDTMGLSKGEQGQKAKKENADYVHAALFRLVKALRDANKKIIIIGSIPEVEANVPRVMANNLFWDKNRDIRPTRKEYDQRQQKTMLILKELEDMGSIMFIDPSVIFCDKQYCRIADEDKPLYLDHNHVSDVAAYQVLQLLKPYLQ